MRVTVSKHFKPSNLKVRLRYVYFVDDCFGDMDEPLYGFIVEVTVSENQTCQVFMSSEDINIPQCQLFREDEKEIVSGMSI